MGKKYVKNFEEATEAIQDIVFNAKIPVISMVAILETTKFELLRHSKGADAKKAKEFLEALQKKADMQSDNKGVS